MEGKKLNKIDLIVIDGQEDFCNPKTGRLFVPGADKDMSRLAAMVRRLGSKIDAIHATMDSHSPLHIAHPIFWTNLETGEHPNPFTTISLSDLREGVWVTSRAVDRSRAEKYLEKLEKRSADAKAAGLGENVYPLTIWPPHCLIGHTGWCIVPELHEAFVEWEMEHFRKIHYITKGSNPYTEHYSALKAEVPDAQDPGTQLNTRFVQMLEEADIILLAGEAGSHCLLHTVTDVADSFSDAAHIKKFVLLEDATSAVPGFEQQQVDFIDRMKKRGMRVSTTTQFLAS